MPCSTVELGGEYPASRFANPHSWHLIPRATTRPLDSPAGGRCRNHHGPSYGHPPTMPDLAFPYRHSHQSHARVSTAAHPQPGRAHRDACARGLCASSATPVIVAARTTLIPLSVVFPAEAHRSVSTAALRSAFSTCGLVCALALREPRALAQALGAARSTGRELARDARTVIVALGAEISRPLLAVCQ